jgi:membrane-associated phospholipid phosphatase
VTPRYGHYAIVIFIVSSLSFSGAASQTDANAREVPLYKQNLFTRIFTDQRLLVTDWFPRQLSTPGLGTGLFVSSLLAANSHSGGWDVQWEQSIDRAGGQTANRWASTFTSIGNSPVEVLGLGIGWLSARWSGNTRLEEATSLSAEALADAGIWVIVLKEVTHRARPMINENGQFFSGAPHQVHSFPSGHAMDAFALASVFSGVYRAHRWVPWVAFGTAGLIGASRVTLGRHFPSDVVVGGLLGASVGRFVVARSREEEGDDAPLTSWLRDVRPYADPDGREAGLVYEHRW